MKKKKKKFIIISSLILVIALLIFFFLINNYKIKSELKIIEKITQKLNKEYSVIEFIGISCKIDKGYLYNCKKDNEIIYFGEEKIEYKKSSSIKGNIILNKDGKILNSKLKLFYNKCSLNNKFISCKNHQNIYKEYKISSEVYYNPIEQKFCKKEEKNCYLFNALEDSNKYNNKLTLMLSSNLGKNLKYTDNLENVDSKEYILNALKERTKNWKVSSRLISYEEVKKIINPEKNQVSFDIEKSNFLLNNFENTKGYYTITDFIMDDELVFAVTENKITGVSKEVEEYGIRPIIEVEKEIS